MIKMWRSQMLINRSVYKMSIFSVANNELRFIRESREKNLIDIVVHKKQQSQVSLDADNIEQLTIETCGSLSVFLESLNSSLKDIEKVTIITFENVSFDSALDSDELEVLTSKCLRKSIVVFIISKSKEEFLIYWKSSEIDQFLSFKPYSSTEMVTNKTLFQFIVKFLARSLNQRHLGEISSTIIFSKKNTHVNILRSLQILV